ncbi:PKD domain-containing protein, partial [Flavobacteriales bacterium]|nr:PKD domain-containing protein [Flavobacteriales bacterium]
MFSLLNNLHSQSQVIEKCGFDRLRNILLQDSNYLRKEIEAEQKIAQYISQSQLRSSSSIYTIPVVVHVLHLGELLGVGTNISDAQIQSAINNLNDVYRGQTAGSPVDFEIEFALAQQDPNCSAHSGINRINASSVPNYSTGGVDYYGDGGEADETILKDLSRWPEAEYFNIWIVSEIEDNNGGYGIQGYANFFTGSAYEGSMMMATVFGFDPTSAQSSFNLNAPRDNSTVVHEIGHYLHLHHTFKGDGDADNDGIGDACPGDVTIGVDSDGCADTEPHKRYTSQCKSGLLNDCTGATFGDNTAKNFMSYASCQDRLTSGQKTRSRAMLATSGISLIFSKGDESPLSISGTLTNANCTPQSSSTATSGGYGGIMNFTVINEFSASSSYTQNDGGYVDFTTDCLKTIALDEDSTYNFELTTWYNGHDYKGYIDFNNDGDFLDANEEVFSGANPPNLNGANGTNTSTGNGTLSIPTADGANVLANTPLRLRIVSELTSVNGTITDACYNPFYAQAEDYQLVINQSAVTLTADFSASDSTLCQVTSVTFTDLSTGTPTSWAWDFGDGTTSSLQNPTHTYASVGTYDVSLTVTTSTGSDSETKTGFITVNSNPNINAGIDQTICDGISTTLNATSGQNYVTEVTAAGSSDYILSGAFSGNDPAINISLGDTLTFNVNSPGHPFLIKTTNTTGTANAVTVTNNGTSSGTIIWSPNSVGTYYYICEYHAGMVGTITVGASNVNYTWSNNITNGTTFTPTSTNTYTVIGTDGNGCFSTDNVTVNLIPNSTGVDVITACDSLIWIDGITYTASNNTATDTLTNAAGCDSVVTLNLTINNSTTETDLITACDSYTWIDGNTYTQTGIYYDSLQSSNGCDSVYKLDLTINQTDTSFTNITACDSVTWNGTTYTQSGTYSHTGSTSSNNYSMSFDGSNYIGIADDPSLNWGQNDFSVSVWINKNNSAQWLQTIIDKKETNSGNYYGWSLGLVNNDIRFVPGSAFVNGSWVNNGTINSTFTVNDNQWYYITGVFDGSNGLTKLYVDGNLISTTPSSYSVNPNNSQNLKIGAHMPSGAPSGPEYFYGKIEDVSIWNTSLTQQEIQNYMNCPPTGNEVGLAGYWNFEEGSGTTALDLTSNGNDGTINGANYSTTVPNQTCSANQLTTVNGCDSIATLNLTINNSTTGIDVISACDTYTWSVNNVTYSTSGLYIDSSLNIDGCTHVDSLDLTIYNATTSVDVQSACDSYAWIDGNTYTTSNNSATYTLTNAAGCDSLVNLNLTVNYSSTSLVTESSCNSYSWNGQILSVSGIYVDTSVNAAGCPQYDSLDLTITTTPNISNEVACDSFAWNGNSYTTSGTYTSLGTCVDTLNLVINNSSSSTSSLSSCGDILWNGSTYTATGIYNFITTNSVGCDSTATLDLTIDSAVVNQVNVTACDSYDWDGTTYTTDGTYYDSLQTSNGCDSVITLNLIINNSHSTVDSITACSSYFRNGTSYTQSGTYYDSLQTSNGCDSVITLNLTINNSHSSVD